MKLRFRSASERGGATVEYALAAAILVAAFLMISDWLMTSTAYRIKANNAAVKGFTPCVDPSKFSNGLLTGEECK